MTAAVGRPLIVLSLFVILCAARSAAAQTACDRACLTKVADDYFAAVVAHDPSKAPLANNVRFTEQTQVKTVGDGLWKTASEAPTTFKIYVADPVVSQIGAIVMMKDAGKPVQLALRLKVQNHQITEAEHLIWTNLNAASLANLQTPRPGLLASVPPAERLPREVLLLYAHGYYDAIEQSDGKLVPFADDCVRREGGMHTAGPRAAATGAPPTTAPQSGQGPTSAQGSGMGTMTCAGQLDTRFMSYIESINLRRVWIADEEKGLVFGLSMFHHPMNEKVLTLVYPDGTRGTRDMTSQRQFDMAAAHVIKVRDRKIHEIEATGAVLPFNSKNGWSDFLR
jgi:hypothetical protein